MLSIAPLPDLDALKTFTAFVLRQAGSSDLLEFSGVLAGAHDAGDNMAARIQDRVLQAEQFAVMAGHPMWKDMAASAYGCGADEILLAFPHFRVDLPSRFSDDAKKISLPWHQEAGYYLEKGNCSPSSIVISTNLHDCSAENGALLVASETEAAPLSHSRRLMDPVNRRFLRVEIEEPEHFTCSETRFGEAVVFDFLRPHRSGVNSSDLVRLTFLIRAGKARDIEDYRMAADQPG